MASELTSPPEKLIPVLVDNLAKTIVGKEQAILLVLVALLAGGHALLEDVPGVGKTLLAKSLAQSIDGKFQRVQCTPDLLPTDITGTNVWNPQTGQFQFLPGPVFTNILLADEINRATPRTQSALLEVMEEMQVTVDGVSRPVPSPFFAIATQNPIEYQGTFPLPEAQLDRFAVSFSLGYPSAKEELQMLQRKSSTPTHQLEACISLADVLRLRQGCQQMPVNDQINQYIVDIVRATRQHKDIILGASPRGTVVLQKTSQALAFLKLQLDPNRRSDYVLPDDVKFLAPHVLAHRVIASNRQRSHAIIANILETVPVP
jgi:MoxR-like ATPase